MQLYFYIYIYDIWQTSLSRETYIDVIFWKYNFEVAIEG